MRQTLARNLSACEEMTGQERSACSPDLTHNSSLPPSLARDDDSIYISRALQKTGSACKQVECPKFKVCVENMQGLPLCTCPSEYICRRRRQRPLCGTDGRTYSSRCHLRIAACNSGTKIKMLRKGACPALDNKGANEAQTEAQRPTHSVPRPASGTSPPSRTCDTPTSCRRRKQRAVCGTDGRTHPSRCHMKIAACQEDVRIRVRHAGACTTSSVASPYDRDAVGEEEEEEDNDGEDETSDVGVSRDAAAPRKRKNNNGNDTGDEGDKNKEDKERRNRRKRKKDMRRRRRKIRDRSRNPRHKTQKKRFMRTFGHFTWKY
ncbi:hypothetical protein C0Q70_13675 [Pomacea canaliculata]|uniref:Kazal-like domain-containing protein n=1 Tax=Pomacea canaliculata TaxID=400727 RepID=A0A2T7NXV3_POMCA|nr:hypothetical protein C0Q70_13675 [Pomacea canaliculata]